MAGSDYEDKWGIWRNLIGDFMMEFSEIEYISYSLWSSRVNKNTPSHNFKSRTKQVISQLNSKNDKKIKLLLEKALTISDKRNIVAHNPTLLQVFEDRETNKLYSEFAISTYVKGDYMNVAELEELTAEVRHIKTQLYMYLGYLPYEDKNRTK